MDTGTWYPSREQGNRGGSQRPEPDAMVEAALAAATPAEAQESIAEADEYLHHGDHVAMAWRRGKSWNRSYLGRPNASQPERALYLRTLANLTNPSEVRGILQLARKEFGATEITPDLLLFADRILGSHYRKLSVIHAGARDLLFADGRSGGPSNYSEFHMSSGERAILRLSKDLSQLRGALVLIDELEVGLHP